MKNHGFAGGVVTLHCTHCHSAHTAQAVRGHVMVVVMVMGRGRGGPVNGNNDTELLSVMCAAASTITSTGPGLDTGILLFRNCEKVHCRPRPAAGCLNGAASRGQDQLRGAAGF